MKNSKLTTLNLLFVLLVLIYQTTASFKADEYLKSKITALESQLVKLRKGEVAWNNERDELIAKNKELEEENDELLDENIDYIQKTANKEYENIYLKSETKKWVIGLSGMMTMILIINIMGYLLFGFKCYRTFPCLKRNKSNHKQMIIHDPNRDFLI